MNESSVMSLAAMPSRGPTRNTGIHLLVNVSRIVMQLSYASLHSNVTDSVTLQAG